MQIRNAKDSDYEQLMELYNIFVGEDRYSQHNNDSFQKVLENESSYLFVAEEEGRVIGFASCSIRNVVRYPRPIVELDEFFVHPDFRKHGIGRQLMEKIEQIARDRNCYRMFIESNYRFKDGHAFYEKIGYTKYGYYFIKNL